MHARSSVNIASATANATTRRSGRAWRHRGGRGVRGAGAVRRGEVSRGRCGSSPGNHGRRSADRKRIPLRKRRKAAPQSGPALHAHAAADQEPLDPRQLLAHCHGPQKPSFPRCAMLPPFFFAPRWFSSPPAAEPARLLDWAAINEEAMRHFQAMVRMDTSDPRATSSRSPTTREARGLSGLC